MPDPLLFIAAELLPPRWAATGLDAFDAVLDPRTLTAHHAD